MRLSYDAADSVKQWAVTLENDLAVSYKVKYVPVCDPIVLRGIHPREQPLKSK